MSACLRLESLGLYSVNLKHGFFNRHAFSAVEHEQFYPALLNLPYGDHASRFPPPKLSHNGIDSNTELAFGRPNVLESNESTFPGLR